MTASNRKPGGGARVDAALRKPALLAAADEAVGDARLREQFGDLGPAFAAAFGSWLQPFAATMRDVDPTAHSQAAARAMTDLARLTGAFAGQAVRSVAGLQATLAVSDLGPGEHHAELVRCIDDSFRKYSSGREFDRVRRSAAGAVLDWLEHDRAAASSIARALETPPPFTPEPFRDPMPADAAAIRLDGNATLTTYPGAGESRASVLVVPGFTTDARVFDLDPQRSTVRTLAKHGVDAWLLDWGRPDATDRMRTVANQLERIDGAVDAVREAANGRRPALAGHFHGGLLALLHCIRHPGKVGALVTLSTPVEFGSSEDAFAGWLRACDGERLVDVFGNVPGPFVAALVAASSPMRWCGGGFFALLDGLDSTAAAAGIARFERARRFPPACPGETFRGLYRAFYRDDSFAADGAAVIDGHRYELSGLRTPLLNVFARNDRIVPPAVSLPLTEWTGTAAGSNREHSGGHYDLLIGHRAHAELLPDIAAWMVRQARGG